MYIDFSAPDVTTASTRSFFASDGVIYSLAFSNDERFLVCAGSLAAEAWELATGRKLYELKECGDELPTFSCRDSRVATCSPTTVDVWDHPGASHFRSISIGLGFGSGRALAFDREETAVILATDKFAVAWNVLSGEKTMSYVLPSNEIPVDMHIAGDGGVVLHSRLQRLGSEGILYTTDIATGARIGQIVLNSQCNGPVHVSQDGTLLLTSILEGSEKRFEVWDLSTKKRVAQSPFRGVLPSVYRSPFSMNGRFVIEGGGVYIWESLTGQCVFNLEFAPDRNVDCCYSASNGIVAAIWNSLEPGMDRTLFIDPMSRRVLGAAYGHSREGAMFSSCGRWFASVVDHNYLVIRPNHTIRRGTIILSDLESILQAK